MTGRRWLIGLLLTLVVAVFYLASVNDNPEQKAPELARQASAPAAAHGRPAVASPPVSALNDTAIRIDATKVLAKVNGQEIKLGDLIPLSPSQTNQEREMSLTAYRFLLDRAVNRALILQTAKAQGVDLDESQMQQLAKFQSQRKQPGPGLVADLNGNSQQLGFETQDAAAFMLQTELLARTGATPNVNEDDVYAYYAQHASDFEDLPAEEPARSQTWTTIDAQVRKLLAPTKRTQFQGQLTAYMNQIKSGADISIAATP